jgi:hypothetical protein
MTRFFAGMLVLSAGAVIAGCSSDGTSSSPETTGPPALCSSTDALQASMTDLRDVQVVENGTAALEEAVASVRSDLENVVDDAKAEYSTQVDDLQAGFNAVQEATTVALNAPSGGTLSAVTSSIRALADDVNTFADDVASTC